MLGSREAATLLLLPPRSPTASAGGTGTDEAEAVRRDGLGLPCGGPNVADTGRRGLRPDVRPVPVPDNVASLPPNSSDSQAAPLTPDMARGSRE